MQNDDAAPSQLRAGMRALQLWCLRISWTGAETVSPSFNVLISDSDQTDHAFETFAVIRPDFTSGLVAPGFILKWQTASRHGWLNRGLFVSDSQYGEAKARERRLFPSSLTCTDAEAR